VKLLFLIFDATIVYLLLQPEPLPRAISSKQCDEMEKHGFILQSLPDFC
jgi:hypothetical protein